MKDLLSRIGQWTEKMWRSIPIHLRDAIFTALLLGIAGAVLGVLMIFDPFKGAKALMIFTGISLLVTGVESIYAIVCISKVFRSSGHQQIIDATWHDV